MPIGIARRDEQKGNVEFREARESCDACRRTGEQLRQMLRRVGDEEPLSLHQPQLLPERLAGNAGGRGDRHQPIREPGR